MCVIYTVTSASLMSREPYLILLIHVKIHLQLVFVHLGHEIFSVSMEFNAIFYKCGVQTSHFINGRILGKEGFEKSSDHCVAIFPVVARRETIL